MDVNMQISEKELRRLVRIVLWEVVKIASIAVIICSLTTAATRYALNATNVGIDNTDQDGHNRSGFRLMVDYGTGQEYLSDGKGGLILRQPQKNSEQCMPKNPSTIPCFGKKE